MNHEKRIKDVTVRSVLSSNVYKMIGFRMSSIYLGKYGSKTASEISKALQLPRTETYHLVNSLQSLGLVIAELAHPTKYTAMEMKTAITTLVKQEQDRIDSLSNKEESLSKLWKEIPFFAVETDESKSEKMQLLHGSGPITNKIKDMINSSTESVRVFWKYGRCVKNALCRCF